MSTLLLPLYTSTAKWLSDVKEAGRQLCWLKWCVALIDPDFTYFYQFRSVSADQLCPRIQLLIRNAVFNTEVHQKCIILNLGDNLCQKMLQQALLLLLSLADWAKWKRKDVFQLRIKKCLLKTIDQHKTQKGPQNIYRYNWAKNYL